MPVATTTLPLTVPLTLEVAVHPIEGGGYRGEFVRFPGCVAQADTLEDLAAIMPRALADYFAEPGKTEADALALARLQGLAAPVAGPFPERYEPVPGGPDDEW